MNLRLTVNYSATDGSMPESVELDWTDEDSSSVGVMLNKILPHLLFAPVHRHSALGTDEQPALDAREPELFHTCKAIPGMPCTACVVDIYGA